MFILFANLSTTFYMFGSGKDVAMTKQTLISYSNARTRWRANTRCDVCMVPSNTRYVNQETRSLSVSRTSLESSKYTKQVSQCKPANTFSMSGWGASEIKGHHIKLPLPTRCTKGSLGSVTLQHLYLQIPACNVKSGEPF